MSALAVRLAAAAWIVALGVSAAHAETVFHCGDSYSHTRCENAKAIDIGAAVSAAQRAEARAVAAREQRLALEVVRDRRERESALRPTTAGSLSPAPAALPASAPGKHHARAKKHGAAANDGRDFVAVVPATKK